jgi:ABC-type polar amino acid transport system ATPase subunit
MPMSGSGTINVLVNTFSGTIIILVIEMGDTVDRFKALIAQRTEFPADQQFWSYRGRPIRNGISLPLYHIKSLKSKQTAKQATTAIKSVILSQSSDHAARISNTWC